VRSDRKAIVKAVPRVRRSNWGIVRIDSTTTQTDFGRNFVEFANKSIKELKLKY
jgi:hypothetical protein